MRYDRITINILYFKMSIITRWSTLVKYSTISTKNDYVNLFIQVTSRNLMLQYRKIIKLRSPIGLWKSSLTRKKTIKKSLLMQFSSERQSEKRFKILVKSTDNYDNWYTPNKDGYSSLILSVPRDIYRSQRCQKSMLLLKKKDLRRSWKQIYFWHWQNKKKSERKQC